MKTKAITILLTLPILLMLMFLVPTTTAQAPIKIGIMGPMGLIQGDGMKEGATLAKEQLGTILGRPVQLVFADEFQGQADGTAETGRLAMEYLMAAGCEFVTGGFRTESVIGAREVAADYGKIYLITGAATNELIDCGKVACTKGADPAWGGTPAIPITCGAYNYSATGFYGRGIAISAADPPCGGGLMQKCAGGSVRCNPSRYQYTFRITPVNSTYLVNAVMGIYYLFRDGFLTYAITELKKVFSPTEPLKYAALVENLAWTAGFQKILSNYTAGGLIPQGLATAYMGPNVKLDYYAAIGPTAESVTTEMTRIINGPDGNPGTGDEARLLIMVFSAEKAGRTFINAWHALGCKAIPIGINVIDQMSESWVETGGGCEYEGFLQTVGTRTPINSLTTKFWDDYEARWGRAPIYTAFGGFMAVNILNMTIGRAGSLDTATVKTQLEAYDELQATGQFRFTTSHDVYTVSYGTTWTDGRPRSLMVQWQNERQELVMPKDKSYSIKWRLPVSMYPYWETDMDRNGKVYTEDLGQVATAWYTSPGDGLWNLDADMDNNHLIDVADISRVAKDYLKNVTIPYIP